MKTKTNRYITILSILVITICLPLQTAIAQVFPVVTTQESTSIYVDKRDASVVLHAAEMLATDVDLITGVKPVVKTTTSSCTLPSQAIVAGTLGQSKLIDALVDAHQLDVKSLTDNAWEQYMYFLKGNQLIIVGSDRRGTAYGLLELSRRAGVSPWVWWADVHPKKKQTLQISLEDMLGQTSSKPSVQYRGLFINDEDWGIQRWSALTIEPEVGDIGPNTYRRICELLLRLKANTLWPAMHSCTTPFYEVPGNKEIVDEYAIIVGTSHCEPMLCNINGEWKESMGEWRYDTNAYNIQKLFSKRAKNTAKTEGIYTMGMRGKHDDPMIVGQDDTESQVKLLEQVVHDQRTILEKQLGQSAEEIPQIFIPYKEVLKSYQSGMELPEDITLMWTDDNYGYIRQLSTPAEQQRAGGAGVYYHTSYWGRPHDYLWLNSTSPAMIWSEMSKAYQLGAKKIWVLNCGDIKPHEQAISLFMDMAFDMSQFATASQLPEYTRGWLNLQFGVAHAGDMYRILDDYYTLATMRRPEFMAWSQVEPVTTYRPTTMTQFHYGDEVQQRIDAYQSLLARVENLKKTIPAHQQDAFYQLVYYPVLGASHLNLKWLYAYKNQFEAKQGRASAAWSAKLSQESAAVIKQETAYYNNQLAHGKWQHMMCDETRHLPVFGQASYSWAPSTQLFENKGQIGLALEGYEMTVNELITNSHASVLPVFNAYTGSRYYIDVFLKGDGEADWSASPQADWIILSQAKGHLDAAHPQQRIWVDIDYSKVPKAVHSNQAPLGHDSQLVPPSYKIHSAIDFTLPAGKQQIGVSVFNPQLEELVDFDGFVEDKGFVVMHAANYSRLHQKRDAVWQKNEGLGYSQEVMTALPYHAEPIESTKRILKQAPCLEYDFYVFNFGVADVTLQALPTHPVFAGRGVRCAVAVDDAEPVIVNFQTVGRSETWKQNVLNNAARASVKQTVRQAGFHKLKIWMVDPGVSLDQILIDLGGKKASYAFPPETKMHHHYGEKIALFADVHFSDLYPASGESYRSLKAQLHSTRLFNENYFAFKQSVQDAIDKGVRYAIIDGDFSDDGQMQNIRGLKAVMEDAEKKHGLRFFLTTGNHDPVRPNDLGKKLMDKAGYATILSELKDYGFFPREEDLYWATPFSNYSTHEYTYEKAAEASNLDARRYTESGCDQSKIDASYVAEPIEGVWLLAIDGNIHPCKNGRFGSSSVGYNNGLSRKSHLLPWVKKVTDEATRLNKRLVVFSHYPVVAFYDEASTEMRELFGENKMQLKRIPSDSIACAFVEAGVHLHFAGHMHIHDTASRTFDGVGSIVNVQIPTIAAYKPGYKLLTLQPNGVDKVETVLLDEVAQFDALFSKYTDEGDFLCASDYESLAHTHLQELVQRRLIKSDWDEEFVQLLENCISAQFLDAPSDTSTRWSGKNLIIDFYRLRNGGSYALDDIPALRVQDYKAMISMDESGQYPQAIPSSYYSQYSLLLRAFDKMMHGLPVGIIRVNPQTGKLQ